MLKWKNKLNDISLKVNFNLKISIPECSDNLSYHLSGYFFDSKKKYHSLKFKKFNDEVKA